MQTLDESPNNINIVALALSGGGECVCVCRGGPWVPYPEAKNLPSLCSATSPRPSTHTRELKIPFTLTGARSWLEKARDKKRFSTEQNHYNGPTLIWAPTLSAPTSANWTLSPRNCHPRRGKLSYAEWSGPQQFTPDSALKWGRSPELRRPHILDGSFPLGLLEPCGQSSGTVKDKRQH